MWSSHKLMSTRHAQTSIHRHSLRLFAEVFSLFVLGVISLSLYLSLYQPATAQASAIRKQPMAGNVVAASHPVIAAQAPTTSTPASQPNVSTAVATPVILPSAPNCNPDTSYQTPGSITPTSPGLQQVIDAPSTYTVYGNSPSQVMNQIDDCTPVHSSGSNGSPGNYAASTAYNISWQLNYNTNASGQCVPANVEVTLHINQVFPQWQATAGVQPGLTSAWQTYIAKLQTYEQGHVQLDDQAAAAVLSDLQNLPATDCETINQLANTTANNDITTYQNANLNYDLINAFGLKQDVVLE